MRFHLTPSINVVAITAAAFMGLVSPLQALPNFMSNAPQAPVTQPAPVVPAAPQVNFESVTLGMQQQQPQQKSITPKSKQLNLAPKAQAPVMAQGSATQYLLGSGDKVRVIVFGEEDLSGEYEIDGTGHLSLPLIGQISAQALSVQNLEAKLTAAYANGYLIAPRISVEVLNFRPFYIVGEVKNPGNYPYINGLTVLNAVAVAGGYTARAKKSNIQLKRTVNGAEKVMTVGETSQVLPGDVLEIKERFF